MSETNQKQIPKKREAESETTTSEAAKQETTTDGERNQRNTKQQKVEPRESNPQKCYNKNVNNAKKEAGVGVTWDQGTSASHTKICEER